MVLPSNALVPARGTTDLPVTSSISAVENPIGFWNVVPWQELGERFEVGVFAFHDDGVDTSLSLDGGPFVEFAEASRNPRTLEYERWSRIDPAAFSGRDKVELRARVTARGSSLSIDFPLELYVTWGGPVAKGVVWADAVSGDDYLGTGAETDPFKTLGRAVFEARISPNINRMRVRLKPGTYEFDHGDWLATTEINGPWLEVQGEDGVILESPAGSVARGLLVRRVKLRDLEVRSALWTPGLSNEAIWLADCTMSGSDPLVPVDFTPDLAWPGGRWATDCVWQTNQTGARGFRLVRNGYFVGVDQAIVDCDFVLNTDALLCDGTVCLPPRGRQFIVKGLRAFDCGGAGIILDELSTPSVSGDYLDGVIGSCVIEAPTALAIRSSGRNLLVWLNTWDGLVAWGAGEWLLCRFKGNSSDGLVNEVSAGVDPEGWAFEDNHHVQSSGSFLVPGSGATSGAAGYLDEPANDYSPSGPAATIQANPATVYVDSDAFGNLRGGEGPVFETARGGIRGTDEMTE